MQNINRRAALFGALVSTAALAVPSGVALASIGGDEVERLIAAHKSALAELSAAYEAEDEASAAYYAATDANPVAVELPGFKMLPNGMKHIGGKSRFAMVNARQISAERIGELYQHYDFYSRRGGYLFVSGQTVKIDLSADCARDEAAALANLDAAFDQLRAVADATGKTAADKRVSAAVDGVEAAWLALLAHSPRSDADAKSKRDYLAERLESDALDFGPDQLAALIASIV